MKNLIMLTMLATSLTACRSTLEHVSEQCSPFIEFIDEKTVDVDQSKCFCRKYKFSMNYVGPLSGTSEDKPLSYCNKVVGFKKYAETATFWELVRREISKDEERIIGEIAK